MKRNFFVFVFLLCLTQVAAAQEQPSLLLGGMEMRLGMPEPIVINHLSKSYDLSELSKKSYIIYDRRRDSEGNYKIIGQVGFDKGKLSFAAKEWFDDARKSAYEFVDILNNILVQMEQRGEILVKVETRNVREPDYMNKLIMLTYGKRQIFISMGEFRSSKSVKISERINSNPLSR